MRFTLLVAIGQPESGGVPSAFGIDIPVGAIGHKRKVTSAYAKFIIQLICSREPM